MRTLNTEFAFTIDYRLLTIDPDLLLEKMEALKAAGVHVCESPADIGKKVAGLV